MAMTLLVLETTDASAQAPTMTITTIKYVPQPPNNSDAIFPVTGSWNIGGFGPVVKITLQVEQRDADGAANPIMFDEKTIVNFVGMGNPPTSGQYNGSNTETYTAGKRYYLTTRLYNSSGAIVQKGPSQTTQ
jgi:hypothetical protein